MLKELLFYICAAWVIAICYYFIFVRNQQDKHNVTHKKHALAHSSSCFPFFLFFFKGYQL